MNLKIWMRLGGILAVLLGVAPIPAVAQGYGRDRTAERGTIEGFSSDEARGREYGRDQAEERGTIRIDNNWRGAVHITVWTNRGRELGGGWRFRSGESAFLAVGERKIKVRPNYMIRSATTGGGLTSGTLASSRTAYGTSACGT
jgi:hypothetical protein